MGCLCLLWRCSREDREPGTGLGEKKKEQENMIPDSVGRGFTACFPVSKTSQDTTVAGRQIRSSDGNHVIEDIREIITNKTQAWLPLLLPS